MDDLLTYPVVVEPLSQEDGGGYLATVPDLPGCMGDGETPEGAVSDVQLAVREWIDQAKRLKRQVPAPHSMGKEVRAARHSLVDFAKKQYGFLMGDVPTPEIVEVMREMVRLLERAKLELDDPLDLAGRTQIAANSNSRRKDLTSH